MSLQSALEASSIMQDVEAKLQQINLLLRGASDDDRRKAGLHWQYILIACGDPRGGQGTKPIFDSLDDDRRRSKALVGARTAQNHNPTYREEMRQKMRASRHAEPAIWSAWPAWSPEEKAEQKQREAEYWLKVRKRLGWDQPAPVAKSEWDIFLEKQARSRAQKSGTPQQVLLQDPHFLAQVKASWEILQEIGL